MASGLDELFTGLVPALPCSAEAKGYIVGVFSHFAFETAGDMSRTSLVLEFVDAKQNYNFIKYQTIGDWVLWASTFVPETLKEIGIAHDLARWSYAACYRMMDKRWVIYEELADGLPTLVHLIRGQLHPGYNLPRVKSLMI